MNEVWYVMADGSVGDPAEISAGPDGVLRHTDGRAVAYKPHGPVARMIDPVAERARAALMDGKISANEARAVVGKPPIVAAKEVKPAAQAGGYRTREAKAG